VVAAATVAVTAIGVGITGTVVSGPVSHASPPPTTTASVEKQVNALNEQMDAVVEKYDRATLDLTTAKRQAAVAKQRVAAARQRLAQAKADLAQVAAAAYRGSTGAESVVNSFVAADNPQQFVDQTTTLDELSRTRVATLQAVIAAEKQLAAAQRQADDELAAAQRIAVQIARHKAEIRRALRKQRELLGHLQAQERARLAAHQAASAQQESALGAATVANGHYGGTGSAAVAVEWAYRELGKPYVWGAAGPNGFDCSGLTMYVWARAGVSLPHSAAAQYGAGTPVSRADLQPGDLVFFGSPIYHVGIYVGGGNMIEAPHTGDVVKVMPLAYEPNYAGAVRP
jgi:cell wall-associated NlpC family hydrolase